MKSNDETIKFNGTGRFSSKSHTYTLCGWGVIPFLGIEPFLWKRINIIHTYSIHENKRHS